MGSENTRAKQISRILVLFCLLLAVFLPAGSEAQRVKHLPRIGVLRNDTPILFASRNAAMREGLQELGYVEGENILFEYR
jgi:hypothetical protein